LSPETEQKLRVIEGIESAKTIMTYEQTWVIGMMSEKAVFKSGWIKNPDPTSR
jgi:hypothetical protein